jgi:class 3 adenylate cyclase
MISCPACGQANPDGFQFCGRCATPLALPAPARRRLVTVLFCDVSGSTAIGERLDAESVREVMSRYFSEMRESIERHGGTVEKFIGDAVMAVFGLPSTREDDALRAVRAASAMQERIGVVNQELTSRYGTSLAVRIGVNTGEVVAGDHATHQAVVTGDAVNVAARLEQAAAPGRVLLGALTHRLVAHAVEARPLGPVVLKGKARPVVAFELLAIRDRVRRPVRHLGPLVGRQAELDALRSALRDVADRSAARVLTVVGEAGVGKSRLLEEVAARSDGVARILTGRCLSYGQGITYWPIAEVVRKAAGIGDEDEPEVAIQRITTLVAGSEPELAARRIAQTIGLLAGAAPQAEIAWAVRCLMTGLAADGTVL